jgi:wyosine [tRNA(Phe)-imidazoG37] synthetase (radical SAM superfamily)
MKKYLYLYGPVPSRRLGRSLGIDLVPQKICTYDCIYCQIGKTTTKTLVRKAYIPTKKVIEELEDFLEEEESSIDHFSLSGSGEPTLHSQIGSVIESIKALSSIPVAVITNGSLFYEDKVRRDLLRADVILPSLDAVSPEVFEKINRPPPGFSIEKVIKGLIEFRKIYKGKIWLEILFCRGVNDSPNELQKMKEVIERIQPDLIHLNTVVRPPSEIDANPLNQEEIEEIKDFFGEKASIISEFNRHPSPISEGDLKEKILKILKRRPLSLTDLSLRMAIPSDLVYRSVDSLMREGKIQIHIFGDLIYYKVLNNSKPLDSNWPRS